MAESNKNNVANVSSAKGVKGGYIFTAPAGTALPTDYRTALPAAWKCLGYISEDGYVETLDTDSEDIKDMNGDLMASPQTSRVESAQLTLAEIKAATLKVMYGSDNVTDEGGMITVKHNGNSDETWPAVLELVLKDGRRWRKVVPLAQSSELDDLTLAVGELAARPHGQVPHGRCRQHLLRLHPVHRDRCRQGRQGRRDHGGQVMTELTFTIPGIDGEFTADLDELLSYKTNKQFAKSETEPGGMFEAFERVFAGRDEEYMERLGGSVESAGVLMQAAFEAAKAKNSQDSSSSSKGTAQKS